MGLVPPPPPSKSGRDIRWLERDLLRLRRATRRLVTFGLLALLAIALAAIFGRLQ